MVFPVLQPISRTATQVLRSPSPELPPAPRNWRAAADDIALFLLVVNFLWAAALVILWILP